MATTNINRLFEIAHNEKDVENAYRYAFISQFKDFEITSPFGCDGFGVSKLDKVKVLLEFKDDLDLTNKTELAKVVAQSIYYVKKFYQQGLIPPSTVFIGDRNECLTFHVNDILQYLDLDIDWTIAPSSAHKNVNLISKIIEDDKISKLRQKKLQQENITLKDEYIAENQAEKMQDYQKKAPQKQLKNIFQEPTQQEDKKNYEESLTEENKTENSSNIKSKLSPFKPRKPTPARANNAMPVGFAPA